MIEIEHVHMQHVGRFFDGFSNPRVRRGTAERVQKARELRALTGEEERDHAAQLVCQGSATSFGPSAQRSITRAPACANSASENAASRVWIFISMRVPWSSAAWESASNKVFAVVRSSRSDTRISRSRSLVCVTVGQPLASSKPTLPVGPQT